MKREDKNALSQQRILSAAFEEFSEKGYEGASLNTVWAENGLSKGIIYHYFKDKDEIYLLCVKKCFEELTAALSKAAEMLAGTPAEKLTAYFDARTCFFAENPRYLGIFCDALFHPPAALAAAIEEHRQEFDALNISVLTGLLSAAPLRKNLSVEAIAEDFRMYIDFFNLHFKTGLDSSLPPECVLKEHEKRCHRQIGILLYGVFDKTEEKGKTQEALKTEEK